MSSVRTGHQTDPYTNPPPTLHDLDESILGAKMRYIGALLRWANRWVEGVQDMDVDTALTGLARAKHLRRLAEALERTFEEAAIAEFHHAGTGLHAGDGFTAVLRRSGKRRNWNHAAVMNDLVDTTTHRLTQRHAHVPEDVVRAITTEAMWQVHKTGRVEWRSSDLADNGLNPDDYSTRSGDRPTVDLRGQSAYTPWTPKTKNRRRIA